jgi:flagellar protein FliS
MNVPTQAALARYGAVKVTTASPAQVLVMLYDGLLRFLREAQEAMRQNKRGRAGERISRSHAILQELVSALDPEQSPQLCERLQSLYLFCMQHLLRANIEQDPAKIADIVRLLVPLRDAWSTAAVEVAKAGL